MKNFKKIEKNRKFSKKSKKIEIFQKNRKKSNFFKKIEKNRKNRNFSKKSKKIEKIEKIEKNRISFFSNFFFQFFLKIKFWKSIFFTVTAPRENGQKQRFFPYPHRAEKKL